MFYQFESVLQGGIAFVAIKGVLKIYYKQQQYLRQANRIIRDYEEDAQDLVPANPIVENQVDPQADPQVDQAQPADPHQE